MTLRRVLTLLLALLLLASPMMEALPAIAYAEETAEAVTEATEETTEATTEATEAEETTEVTTEATEAEETTVATEAEETTEVTEAEETTEATEAEEPTEVTEAEETTEMTTEATEETEYYADDSETDTILADDKVLVTGLKAYNDDWSVTLEWNAVEGVDGYTIFHKTPGSKNYEIVIALAGNDVTSHTINYTGTDDSGNYWTSPMGKYTYAVAPYIMGSDGMTNLAMSKAVTNVFVDNPHIWIYPEGKRLMVNYRFDDFSGKGGIQIDRCTNYAGDPDATGLKWTSIKKASFTNPTGIQKRFADAKANVSGKEYYYRARLYMTIGGKTHYGPYCYYTENYLAAPTITKIEKTDEGMAVTWKTVKGAEYYFLDMHSYVNNTGSDRTEVIKVTDPAAGTFTYVDTKATEYGYYGYQLHARILWDDVDLNDYQPEEYERLSWTHSEYSQHKSAVILTTPVVKNEDDEYMISNTTNGIELWWNWVDNASNYEVWRSVNGGTPEKIKTLNQDTYFFDKTATKSGTKYTYQIRALCKETGGTFYSDFSESMEIVHLPAPVVKNIKKLTAGGFSVTFGRVANADYYIIHHLVNGNRVKEDLHIPQTNDKTYTFKHPEANDVNLVYEYEILAVDDSTGGMGVSFAAAINYGDTDFTAQNTTTGIRLQAHAEAASHYVIYRSVNNGAFKQLKKVAVNPYTGSLDWIDKDVAVGKTYSYKLQPVSQYVSAYRTRQSSPKTITRVGAPALNTPLNEKDGIRLTWTPNAKSPAVVEYAIWRADDRWGYEQYNTTLLTTLPGTEATYLDTSAVFHDGGYAYWIEATLEDGTAVSSLVRTTTRMPTPWIKEIIRQTSTSCFVLWDCEGYYAEGNQVRLIDRDTRKSRIVTTDMEWGYKEIGDLTPGTSYYVSVRHFVTYAGKRVYSAWSDPVVLN